MAGLKISKVDVWAAGLQDKPGALAKKLGALAQGGANLQFVISRRMDKGGRGVVFVTPIQGAKQVRAAKTAGFKKTPTLHSVRVQAASRRGALARIAKAIADAGINLRGCSGAAVGGDGVAHFAFDSRNDANKAMRVLKKL
jgi:hypothetical protein